MTTTNDNLFSRKSLIGVIHIQALPGSPRYRGDLNAVTGIALEEAQLYEQNGYDAIILENMHDRPYLRKQVGPETVAAMAAVGKEVAKAVKVPLGIQILAGANCESLAVALAIGAQFVRVEGFVFSHVADEGWIDACAGQLLRYRKNIGAEHIKILTDIKKKHCSHSVTEDISLGETAHAAEFFLSDGLIVSGSVTGKPPEEISVKEAKTASRLPLYIGSGVNVDNLQSYFEDVDGFIVGSSTKVGGHWENSLDPTATATLAAKFKDLINEQSEE